jgi:TolB protein
LLLVVLTLIGLAQDEPSGVIAYSVGSEIRLIDADGENDRRLWYVPIPEGLSGVRGLDWRPDGGAIAFGSDHQLACSYYDGDIFTIQSNGTGLKRITNSPACPQLAPFPKGSVRVTLQNLVTNYSLYYLYVEGASTAVAVTIAPGTTQQVVVSDVADLGNFPQKITVVHGNTRWLDPAVTANVQAGTTVSASTTFVISPSANSFENVGASHPTWKFDASQIGFVFYEGILRQIAANPPVAGDSQLLTAPGSGATGTALAWSPVGNSVLYTGFDAIRLVQPGATTAGQTLVTKDGSQLFLGIDWLPDGSGFIFAVSGGDFGQSNSNLYEYVIATDELTQITHFTTQWAGAPGVSPDGNHIVFEYSADAEAPAEIRIIRRDGTGMRSLGVNGHSPDWQPGSVNLFAHLNLPVVLNNYRGAPPQPSPTPGATATPRPTNTPQPTPTATSVALPQLKNGNFDQGANGDWLERVDDQNATGAIILKPGGAISPRSGQYVAWLGGLNDETHEIAQTLTLNTAAPLYLRYYYQIRSGETEGCEFDQVGVFIDDTLVMLHNLCEEEETAQWQKGSIDLADYAGDSITITFFGAFDESVVSSFFVDDVSIAASP